MVRVMNTLAALSIALLIPAAAHAHTLYLFVQNVDGAAIHGRADFPGDVPAQNADIIARDAAGHELGRTTTDEKGNFTLTAQRRVEHRLVAETADGHASRPAIVPASALPDGLPGADSASGAPPVESSASGSAAAASGGAARKRRRSCCGQRTNEATSHAGRNAPPTD